MNKMKCVKCEREWKDQECAILEGALNGRICVAGIGEYQFTCEPCREARDIEKLSSVRNF